MKKILTKSGTILCLGMVLLTSQITEAQSWSQKTTGVGYSTYRMHFPSSNVGYITGWNYDLGSSFILKTTDGATTFTQSPLPFTNCYVGGVCFTSDIVGYAVGSHNQNMLSKTTDGGSTWTSTELASSGAAMQLNDVDFFDANNGIAVGYYGAIFTTSDAGGTWTNHEVNFDYNYEDIEYIDATHAWTTGNDYPATDTSVAFFSGDGGVTWTKKLKFYSPGNDALNAISFPTVNDGWIVGSNNQIYHTSDGGTTWVAQATGGITTSATFTGVSFISSTDGWISGNESGSSIVLKTTDGGATWTKTIVAGNNYSTIQMISAYKGYMSGDGNMFFKYSVPGAALDFDGTDDFVSLTVAEAETEITNEFWFKTTTPDQGLFSVTDTDPPGSSAFDRNIFLSNGNINAYVWGGGPTETITTSGTNYADGNWHHIAYVMGASVGGQKLYVDGILKASGSYTSSVFNWNTKIILGFSFLSPGNKYFQGEMDEVRIWNTARTPCEIKSYMNCEVPGTATNLIANYHFNQGVVEDDNSSVTTLSDASGNASNGTLSNFALTGTTSNWVSPGAVVSGYSTVADFSSSSQLTVSNCDSYTWFGTVYSSSGDKTHVLTNAAGCDSTITLHLTIKNSTSSDTTAAACGSFTWYGQTYSSSGDQTRLLTNAAGCDSIVTLHLTINNSTVGDTTAVACGSFTWYGQTYSSSGDQTHLVTNAAGCDSTVTLHLTINNSTSSDTTAVACDSFTWYGQTYSSSGDQTRLLTNAAGCDSTVTLHLTINNSTSSDTTASACGSFTWYGQTYSSSGDKTRLLTNAAGCDSVITMHLTITNLDLSVTVSNNTAMANEAGAAYQWLDCNNANAVITGEVSQTYVPTQDGSYAVIVDNGVCADTSACQNMILLGIDAGKSNLSTQIVVYPNPGSGMFNVQIADSKIKTASIKVYNAVGALVYQSSATNNQQTVIDLTSHNDGVYLIQVITVSGITQHRIVKQ